MLADEEGSTIKASLLSTGFFHAGLAAISRAINNQGPLLEEFS